jgi:D-3-phosphoglycerate dehydrogenase / 2-oxoglutarate reductase
MSYRVLVTDDRFGSYNQENTVLQEIGVEVEVCDLTNGREPASVLKEADALLVNLYPVQADLIEALDRCRIISRYGVGYDNVDVQAATAAGIWVASVPDYAVEDVAAHTLGLLLSAIRRIHSIDREVRKGRWDLHKEHPIIRITGRTLGLVGYGRIGRAVHTMCSGLGLGRVLVHDPYIDQSLITHSGAEPVDLETLLRNSEFVSLHTPLTPETDGFIDAGKIAMMKPGSVLINTARGRLVKQKELIQALEADHLAYAGLDVLETEPVPPDDPILGTPNAVLSAHTAFYSEESIAELKIKAAQNILAVLTGNPPVYPVNTVPANAVTVDTLGSR